MHRLGPSTRFRCQARFTHLKYSRSIETNWRRVSYLLSFTFLICVELQSLLRIISKPILIRTPCFSHLKRSMPEYRHVITNSFWRPETSLKSLILLRNTRKAPSISTVKLVKTLWCLKDNFTTCMR